MSDRIFNKNYDNRYSKTTQSPGMSAIFGGATQSTEKQQRFQGSVQTEVAVQNTTERSTKYTNTFKSSVFEQHGYKSKAETFYTTHDGSAAQNY